MEHGYCPAGVVDFIYHAIVPDTDPPTCSAGELTATGRSRIVRKESDSVTNPLVGLHRQAGEFTLSAAKDEQRIAH